MPPAPSGATPLNAPLILPSPSIQLARTPVNSTVLLPLRCFPRHHRSAGTAAPDHPSEDASAAAGRRRTARRWLCARRPIRVQCPRSIFRQNRLQSIPATSSRRTGPPIPHVRRRRRPASWQGAGVFCREATRQRPECPRHSPYAKCQQSWDREEAPAGRIVSRPALRRYHPVFAGGPRRSWHGALHVPHPSAFPSPAAVPPGPASPACLVRPVVIFAGAA